MIPFLMILILASNISCTSKIDENPYLKSGKYCLDACKQLYNEDSMYMDDKGCHCLYK